MFTELMASGSGGDSNVWRTSGTFSSSSSATITDCPFSPDIVFVWFYNGSDKGTVAVGGNSFVKYSSGIADQGYIFTNYGVTVSGNTITVNTGFSQTINQAYELIAIKNS